MQIKFAAGSAMLEAVDSINIDRLTSDGPMIVVDFSDIAPENRLIVLDQILHDLGKAAVEHGNPAIASVAAMVSKQRPMLAPVASYTDTHAVTENPSPEQESHSLPSGEVATSNVSQQSSSDAENEETTDGAEAQEQADVEVVGNRKRRSRDRG